MFLLFDRNEKYISTLKDILEARHTEEINGEDTLDLTTLDQSVSKGHKIAYKANTGEWKEFDVKEIAETHTLDGIERAIFCESSFYETFGDYIEDKRPTNTSAENALSNALEVTRWQVGIVDDLGLSSTNFYRTSAKEAIQEIAKVWKGEIQTRVEVIGNKIANRYVDLFYKRGGDYGRRFTYSKDLESVTKTVHRGDVITALYGYGKGEEITDAEGNATGGYGRRIDFAGINGGMAYATDGYTWAEFESTYADWTELESAYPNWQHINSKGIDTWGRNNPDGIKTHVFASVEFDDVEDPAELLKLTKERLAEISQPQITYEAKVINLDKKEGLSPTHIEMARYTHLELSDRPHNYSMPVNATAELGDTVAVIDKEFTLELRLKARVVKIVRDLLHPENNDIMLGNFIPNITDSMNSQKKYIDNFRSRQGVWDRSGTINKDGTINANFLNNLVDELNAKMNSQGGYVYISEDGQGLTTYNKPRHENPNMAIQLLGGAFRIASSRNPDGTWNWRTFGDGNGFVADEFIGGMLKGGKVNFDLTNGTLLIGNSTTDYTLYFDGTNLTLRGGTITGATVRTSAGADRIQLTNSVLEAYLNNVRRVLLDYDSLDFNNAAGQSSGSIVGITYDDNIPRMVVHSKDLVEIVSRASAYELSDPEARIWVPNLSNDPVVQMAVFGLLGSSMFYMDESEIFTSADNFNVTGDFTVSYGTKAAVVETANFGHRKLYALETPDNRFVTYIEKELDIGEHYIEIEPMFMETISDYFVVPHIQNMASVSILERFEDGFRVLIDGEKPAEVVFEVNGKRIGFEDIYMEEVKELSKNGKYR